ncbi:hypothetical protein [Streptomyces mangrovi]|uniref:hypothetical protein n=1 Tax=Streptomyces mangrovi TaxID=1206892 RepID=UPI00399D250E
MADFWIRVYKVNPATRRRQEVSRWASPPERLPDVPLISGVWPPCECPRCDGSGRPPARTT